MSLAPESIAVGKCYLTDSGHVRRVLAILIGHRVQYEQRSGRLATWKVRRGGLLDLRTFSFTATREVPCDWTPAFDEAE